MAIREIIRSQYLASLEMLDQAIKECPADLWENPDYSNQFWQIAYHALFYTHLYLQPNEEDFIPRDMHYEQAHRFSTPPAEQSAEGEISEPMQKDALLAYLEFCRKEVDVQVKALNLDDDSGFSWIPFSKQELQFYNIRHLQHHTGELCERLGTKAGIEIKWVGMMK